MAKRVQVSYGETVSKNYQSKREDFGFDFEVQGGPESGNTIRRAKDLCQAMVKSALGVKLGKSRRELDGLAQEFFSTSWHELSTGHQQQDELL